MTTKTTQAHTGTDGKFHVTLKVTLTRKDVRMLADVVLAEYLSNRAIDKLCKDDEDVDIGEALMRPENSPLVLSLLRRSLRDTVAAQLHEDIDGF